eukprot:SAG11_NODE_6987_length_1214_cov_0.947085_2_plen_192_part_00
MAGTFVQALTAAYFEPLLSHTADAVPPRRLEERTSSPSGGESDPTPTSPSAASSSSAAAARSATSAGGQWQRRRAERYAALECWAHAALYFAAASLAVRLRSPCRALTCRAGSVSNALALAHRMRTNGGGERCGDSTWNIAIVGQGGCAPRHCATPACGRYRWLACIYDWGPCCCRWPWRAFTPHSKARVS